MTNTITLASDFSVDAIEYASRANAILGIRDSGKTYTGTLIAEQLFDGGIPFFAFDPIGRWRFLRVPGKNGAGFPIVVAGGAAPDLPLTPENVAELVRAAMRSGVSMVLDLYSIGLSKSDWRKIVRIAIETILYEGDGQGLRHVFLEEAAEFIPQHVRDGQTYAAVEKLARMGGNVGVGVTLINQRAEEVNKAVLELCDNLLLHRQRGKNSLLSLRKWLDAGNVKPPKEITDSLADLPTGQCWAWFKDEGRPRLIKIAKKLSFDPNRRAMSRGAAVANLPVDVTAFVAKMKAVLAGKPVPKAATIPAPPPAAARVPAPIKEDAVVKESEAKVLREENAALNRKIERLEKAMADIDAAQSRRTAPTANGTPIDTDAIYAEVVERVLVRIRADPALIALALAVPEIVVTKHHVTITLDGTTIKGRISGLLLRGFFDQGTTNNGVRTELKRTGSDVNNANIGRVLAEMVSLGFLTNESDGYKAVPGMKINIIEA